MLAEQPAACRQVPVIHLMNALASLAVWPAISPDDNWFLFVKRQVIVYKNGGLNCRLEMDGQEVGAGRPTSCPPAAAFLTGSLRIQSLPRPATSQRPESESALGRTYLSKIRLESKGKQRRLDRIAELESQLENERLKIMTPDAGGLVGQIANFPHILLFSNPTSSKALERRLSELEFRMTNMQALNQKLVVQMQQEKTARSAAETECAQLKEKLKRAHRFLIDSPP